MASGSIRPSDESDALSVDLSIGYFEVTMRAGRVELGNWLTSAVTIRRIDDASFEFIAEGDRLIFVPDDPASFGEHRVVDEPEGGKRKRRRKAKKKEDEAKNDRSSQRAASKERRSARRRRAEAERLETKPPEPSLEDRKAAVEEVVSDPPPPPDPAEAIVDDGQPEADGAPPDEAHRRIRLRRRRAEQDPEPDEEALTEPDDELNRLWIRAIDVARRYDLLGLDRVPIDEDLRGQEHEHTWDHRVAATSGAGNHICTICGKIRR